MSRTFHRLVIVGCLLLVVLAIGARARRTGAFVVQESPAVRGLIDQAMAALERGDAQMAASLFERATGQGESLEAELGQVRANLQLGAFRKAVALANQVAGEHRDSTEATALLAFVEDRVGRTERALGLLQAARAEQPEDIALVGATAEILIDRHGALEAAALLDGWVGRNAPNMDLYRLRARAARAMGTEADTARWRQDASDVAGSAARTTRATTNDRDVSPSRWPAPFFESLSVFANVAVSMGNGVIIDQGRRILTRSGIAEGATKRQFVRNGLGRVREAIVETVDPKTGMAVLRLPSPYPNAWALRPEQAGKPVGRMRFCFVLGFPIASSLDAAYPSMSSGLVFRSDVGDGLMQITSALSPDHDGSPVFDASGYLIAIALGTNDPTLARKTTLLGSGHFALRVDGLGFDLPSLFRGPKARQEQFPPNTGAPSVEELYERLTPAVVQIVWTR